RVCRYCGAILRYRVVDVAGKEQQISKLLVHALATSVKLERVAKGCNSVLSSAEVKLNCRSVGPQPASSDVQSSNWSLRRRASSERPRLLSSLARPDITKSNVVSDGSR